MEELLEDELFEEELPEEVEALLPLELDDGALPTRPPDEDGEGAEWDRPEPDGAEYDGEGAE